MFTSGMVQYIKRSSTSLPRTSVPHNQVAIIPGLCWVLQFYPLLNELISLCSCLTGSTKLCHGLRRERMMAHWMTCRYEFKPLSRCYTSWSHLYVVIERFSKNKNMTVLCFRFKFKKYRQMLVSNVYLVGCCGFLKRGKLFSCLEKTGCPSSLPERWKTSQSGRERHAGNKLQYLAN